MPARSQAQITTIPTTKWFCSAVLRAGTPNHFESSIYSREKVGRSPNLLQKENKIKDQKIEALEARLAKIEAILEKLPVDDSQTANPGSQQPSTNSVRLSDATLEQNQPNPFNGSTVVRYFIPQDVKRAELLITDLTGKIIKSVAIRARGEGQTTFDATTLSSGSYQYSLFLDNHLLDTRQMVLTKN